MDTPVPVDLNGWDTAFALRLEEFNRQLGVQADATARHQKSARGTLDWIFRDAKVTSASGGTLDLDVGFAASSRLTLENPPAAQRTVDVSSYRATLEAQMALVPRVPGGETQSLKGGSPSPAQAWVRVDVTPPDDDADFLAEAVLVQLLTDWLGTPDGLGWFNSCFNALTVDTPASPATWLQPRIVGFAGAELEDGDAVVGLLGKIEEKATPLGALYQLSPYAVHGSAPASYTMSSRAFLAHLLVPALGKVFADPGGKEPRFEIRDFKVWNADDVSFIVTTDDGKQHLATVPAQRLSLAILDDLLLLAIDKMGFDITVGNLPLVHVEMTLRESLRAHLGCDAKTGKTVFLLDRVDTEKVVHDEQTLYALGGQLLITVVFAIGSVLLARFGPNFLVGKGLSLVSARIWTAVAVLVADAIGYGIGRIPDILAHFEELSLDGVPDFGALIKQAVKPIQWKSGGEYVVTGGRFAGALQVDLAPAKAG